MHGLPVSLLNSETAMELGGKIGVVLSTKHSEEMIGGDFIDVTKPLCRGRKVALDKKDEVWVSRS